MQTLVAIGEFVANIGARMEFAAAVAGLVYAGSNALWAPKKILGRQMKYPLIINRDKEMVTSGATKTTNFEGDVVRWKMRSRYFLVFMLVMISMNVVIAVSTWTAASARECGLSSLLFYFVYMMILQRVEIARLKQELSTQVALTGTAP